MEYKSLLIRGIDKAHWDIIFSFVLNKSDNFKMYLPDGDRGILNTGVADIKAFPAINIKTMDRLDSSMEISGPINEEVKNVLVSYDKPSLMGEQPVNQSFRLFMGDRELLYVKEPLYRIINLMDSEIKSIEEMGIDTSNWELIKLNSEEDDGIQIVDLFNVQTSNLMDV